MSQIIQHPAVTREHGPEPFQPPQDPTVRTDAVYVVFTSIEETMAAVPVAKSLAEAMGVPLTLLHFRTVPFALPVDQPTGVSPLAADDFVARLREQGIDLRVRVLLCRNERGTIPFALRQRSLVVIGGRRSWWPTLAERWRRALEAAGHFVLFVDGQEVLRA